MHDLYPQSIAPASGGRHEEPRDAVRHSVHCRSDVRQSLGSGFNFISIVIMIMIIMIMIMMMMIIIYFLFKGFRGSREVLNIRGRYRVLQIFVIRPPPDTRRFLLQAPRLIGFLGVVLMPLFRDA